MKPVKKQKFQLKFKNKLCRKRKKTYSVIEMAFGFEIINNITKQAIDLLRSRNKHDHMFVIFRILKRLRNY